MKVVLKVTVYDRIYADILKAQRDRREVDYVAVSPEEYKELCLDQRSYGALQSDYVHYVAPSDPINAKATIEVRSFEYTGPQNMNGLRGRFREVPSHETFMGKRLFVVPAEYMPR